MALPTDAWAAALADGGAVSDVQTLDESGALALAWSLKNLCLAAWSSEPRRAVGAATALGTLAQRFAQRRDIAALAHWTGGMADLTEGRMAEGAAQLDQAAALWRALDQPLEAARTQVPKLMALAMQGRHNEAAECGARTLEVVRRLGDLEAAAKVSLNLGSLHMCRDDHAAAVRCYREAAVLFARRGDTKYSVMADIGLSEALTVQGDLAEARRIGDRAAMRASQHGLPQLAAMAGESVALLALSQGEYDRALAGLEGSRRAYEQLQLPQHLAVAEKQLADAYLELHLLPEALALYDRALATMSALDMADEQARSRVQRGRALALLGQPQAAAATLAEAAAQFAALDMPAAQASVALAQAELALYNGDGDTALAQAQAAERAFAAAELPESAARAAALHAAALLALGRPGAARDAFRHALAQARSLQLLSLQVQCLAGLGSAALAQGDRAAATEALRAAVAQTEAQWRLLPGDDLRGAFLADHLAPYQGLLALALQAHADEPTPAHAAEVLQAIDRVRARALAERLRQGHATLADDGTEALRARLNWLQRRVQRQAEDGDPAPALTAALHATEHALLEQARRLRLAGAGGDEASAGAASSPDEGGEPDLVALQAALAEGEALVVFGQSGDELLACVVAGGDAAGGVQVLRGLAMLPAVREAWQAARFQLDALRHGAAPVSQHLPVLTRRAQVRLQALHALVWAPLVAALQGCARVLVVPSPAMAGLPFAALHDGQAPLARRHAVAMAPSVRVAWRGLQRRPRLLREVLAFGESSRLPHAGVEAQAVAARFGQGSAFVGAQATVAALQQQAGHADVLHLACHARFRGDNPMFSALHLHDGQLSAEQAEALPLRAGSLVVLSACETGLAGQQGSDEEVGLVRAFLVAGASRVLASLWPVDDQVTADMMAAFYPRLLTGQAPSQALAEAQALLQIRYPHPAQWAGFVIFGGW